MMATTAMKKADTSDTIAKTFVGGAGSWYPYGAVGWPYAEGCPYCPG